MFNVFSIPTGQYRSAFKVADWAVQTFGAKNVEFMSFSFEVLNSANTGLLGPLLKATLHLRPEPELRFQPDPGAPYDTTARVLNVIKGSGVSAFGFVGNEQFAQFGKAPAATGAKP